VTVPKKAIHREPDQSANQLRKGRRRTISPFSRWVSSSVDADVLSWEDSSLPVDLQFSAPLVERGWSGPFEYHWQLLTHEFLLPDPAAFPALAGFSAAEIAELDRYATGTRQSAVNLRAAPRFATTAGWLSTRPPDRLPMSPSQRTGPPSKASRAGSGNYTALTTAALASTRQPRS
jgi:hypothetical protein